MNARELHNLQLDLQGHTDVLLRALGRGGAPVDLAAVRRTIPYVQGVLFRLLERVPKVAL